MADSDMPNLGRIVQLPLDAHFAVSGIYFLHCKEEVVYVGKSINMRKRIGSHMAEGIKEFDAVSCKPTAERDLDKWERYFISRLTPKYNKCSIAKVFGEAKGWGCDVSLIAEEPDQWVTLQEAAEILGPFVHALPRKRRGSRKLEEMGIICRRLPRSRGVVFSLKSLKAYASTIPSSTAID